MPFLFSYVCDLLQALDDNQHAKTGLRPPAEIVKEWFAKHRSLINREDHDDTALLSTLIPEKRTDRVFRYGLERLELSIGRGLGLGRTRLEELARHKDAQWNMDLAESVERILRDAPNPDPIRPVTVEEIDKLLHDIASHCHFSSRAVRSSPPSSTPASRQKALEDIYKKLCPRDAKWFTRLFLKNYQPVVLDQQLVYREYHFRLPLILKVRDDFVDAGRILADHKRERTVTGRDEFAKHLKPKLGVKVGRQEWIKGRSLKQCLRICGGRMSCEEKYDGEYCQVHIDLSKGYDCIQIFSKSGKDSTEDRTALHHSIRKSLQLNTPSCPLKEGCILEGELLVYSDKEEKILDFYKIRKHVSRSGAFLSTEQDSQRNPWEHLMIVYYDILMVDNESLLAVKHSQRHQRLREIVTEVKGRSMLVQQKTIDCKLLSAESDLRRAFAKCIANRGEGLVLKPDSTYFNFGPSYGDSGSIAIKLKKEYIKEFGDVGDFAVVGARYDPKKAKSYSLPNIKWTHFYIACLGNKDEVTRFKETPKFVVTNVVELNETQMHAFMTTIQPVAVDPKDNKAFSLRIEKGVDGKNTPTTIFTETPVFDIRCFSFDRPGNTGFWTPRFPMVNKIHCDRTFKDVLSFSELQKMAIHGTHKPDKESQELMEWIGRLEQADPRTRGVEIQSQTTVSTSQAQSTPSRSSCADTPRPSSPLSSFRGPSSAVDSFTSSTSVEMAIRSPTNPKPRPSVLPTVDELPRSSAVELLTIARGEKRSHESSTDPEEDCIKLRKVSSPKGQKDVSTSRKEGTSSPAIRREPLAAVKSTSPRRNINPRPVTPPRLLGAHSMYQPTTLDMGHRRITSTRGRISLPHSMSLGPGGSDFTFTVAPLRGQPPITSSPTSIASPAVTNRCCYLEELCTITNISFMLSPCIAGYLWVTEDLLGSHGITEFVRDPKEWLAEEQPTPPAGTPTSTPALTPDTTSTSETTGMPASSAPSCTPGGTKRKKKIILIDPNRKEANKVFLQSVKDASLRLGNGRARHTSIYNWKVLEELMEEEERCREKIAPGGEYDWAKLDMRKGGSIWRKYWCGMT